MCASRKTDIRTISDTNILEKPIKNTLEIYQCAMCNIQVHSETVPDIEAASAGL